MIRIASLSFFIFALISNAFSQLVVDNTVTPQVAVEDILLGEGIIVSNITFSGDPNQIGSFNSANSNIGIGSGIILATGDANVAVGPNNSGSSTVGGGFFGVNDPDLDILSTFNTNDATVLEFDFIATGDSVVFRYVFGSEEYNEYVCGSVNDAFGFFLSGPGITGPFSNNSVNLALVPGTDIPVTINTVNLGVAGSAGTPSNCAQVSPDWALNTAYYVDNENNTDPTSTQMDGLTVVLTAQAGDLQCGETYHIKIAIADAGDTAFDSCVFLEAGSFASNDVSLTASIPNAPVNFPEMSLLEGCVDGFITIFRPNADDNESVLLITEGTATAGEDYEILPEIVTFPEGELTVEIPITTIFDGIDEDTETLIITYDYINSCEEEVTISITLNIINYNLPTLDLPDPLNLCGGETTTVSGVPNDGFGPFTYVWSTGQTSSSIPVSGGLADSIFVDVTDYCGSMVADSFAVVIPPPIFFPDDLRMCLGQTETISPAGGAQPYTVLFNADSLLVDNTSITPLFTGIYTIDFIDDCGLTGSTVLEVVVCETEIPNIFSPNGDGINDIFIIRGTEGFPNSRLEVYNRWGGLVYENDNYQSAWRGDDLAEGTYYYVYLRNDGEKFAGYFQLVR
jgi:gliding motility-associated-like protein